MRLKGKKTAMKALTIAAVALALLVAPAHAQMNNKRHAVDEQKKADPGRPKVDEKAYKAALERIPEPKEKYDPWAVTRPGDTAKKSK
jgi:hypothetical protein